MNKKELLLCLLIFIAINLSFSQHILNAKLHTGIVDKNIGIETFSLTICAGGTTTWTHDISYVDEIRVCTGNTLIVESEVNMLKDAKVIVEPGGKLSVDGGTLTSQSNDHWKGIEIWGNAFQGQSYTYQGAVKVINGGTIENALCAIQTIRMSETGGDGNEYPDYSTTGGIIITDDANFINNRVAIKFWDYDYAQSASFIRNTNFETNDDMIPGTDPETYIIIDEIDGVDIYASSFTDDHTVTSATELITGIETFDADFKVTSFTANPSTFTNLKDGIRALVSNPLKSPEITNNHFYDNLRSVYISGVDGAEVTGNNFIYFEDTVPANEPSYCMYLDYCTGYTVEENDFMFNQQPDQDPTGIGLVVNNSGSTPNEIYRNNFYNLEYGILAQDNNRSGTKLGVGLVLKCNTYDGTKLDKSITTSSWPFFSTSDGIAKNQGSSSSNPEDMAGNLFQIDDYNNPDGNFDDILDAANSITYYYPSNSDNLDVRPVDYTQNTVTLEDMVFQPNWTYEDGCPSNTSKSGDSGEERDKMAEAGQQIDSTANLLAILIDGGDTETTQTEVATSLPPETMQVYNDLMAKSPYLSDTVVSTVIDKEDVLPAAMVRDIMVANPNTAKSIELVNKLDERYEPLPEYMKAQILAGRSIVSIREETESKLAAYQQKKARALRKLSNYYLSDTVNPVASMDSLELLLAGENSLAAQYKRVRLSVEQGAWNEGQNLLNNIPQQFELSPSEAEAHSLFTDYYSLLNSLAQQGKSILEVDSVQQVNLINMVEANTGSTSVFAQNVLLAINRLEYTEPIVLPDLLKSMEAEEKYRELLGKAAEAPAFIKVQPNPAKEYVIIEYELEHETRGAIIEVHEISGNLKFSESIKNKQDQLTIDTQDWRAGIYIITLKVNRKLMESIKFTVID